MLTRFLGGLAVASGLAGGLSAQTPLIGGDALPNTASPATARLGSVSPSGTLTGTQTAAPVDGMGVNRNLPGSYMLPVGYYQAKPMKPAQAAPAKPATTTPMKPAQAAPATPAAGDKPATTANTAPAALPATGLGCAPTGCSTDMLCCDPCGPCGPCGPNGKYWIGAEWIYWKTSGQYVPPLVTTAPVGSPLATAGRLNNVPPSSILFGGQNYNDNFRSGFRITGGVWLDECQKCGIEGDFFYLPSSSTNASFQCDGAGVPLLFRPFFNADNNNNPDTQIVCYPDILRGRVSVSTKSDLIGGGFNFIKNLCCDPCGRVDLLLGYRYINLNDEVQINEDLTALGQVRGTPAGTRFLIEDKFRTENHFHGAVVGINAERRFSHFYANLRTSVAFGVNRQTTTISGATRIITPAPNATDTVYPGGLLTQPSNIGTYTQNKFCVVPEVGLKVGVQLTEHARLFVGYNYLYMSNVQRAGEQIDLRVSARQIAPATGTGSFPTFPNNTTGFSAHGVSAGFELRF